MHQAVFPPIFGLICLGSRNTPAHDSWKKKNHFALNRQRKERKKLIRREMKGNRLLLFSAYTKETILGKELLSIRPTHSTKAILKKRGEKKNLMIFSVGR